ncbi:hypothetical protein Acr_07g0005960 [Actinidia rufa]|uniref:Uncharacterized protein n=1 Tax=Actinidia rufa TaxID=165716 RepID=A0A7J0EWQ6_9ERIC|nr:hypothetical protein Acr_07g0005960 [Actinidia rufa]
MSSRGLGGSPSKYTVGNGEPTKALLAKARKDGGSTKELTNIMYGCLVRKRCQNIRDADRRIKFLKKGNLPHGMAMVNEMLLVRNEAIL